MKVPFVELKSQYLSSKPALQAAISRVCEDTAFVLGEDVRLFEQEFAAYCGCRFAVGVASGLDALILSLRALGVGPGDEVITVPNTFIATVLAISAVGATPVFVDVDLESANMDPGLVEMKITKRTKAILPVHLYGHPAQIQALVGIARKHGLKLVEDAAQAHGATFEGQRIGSFGDIAAFSFYPGKNLGAYGDGGAITTNNEQLAEQVRILRDVGQKKKYHHVVKGVNSRLDNLQAAILRVKLPLLDEWNRLRREHAVAYDRRFKGSPVIPVVEHRSCRSVYHLYVVQVPDRRDELMASLKTQDIACGLHYPVPVHLQECYHELGHGAGAFPVTERYAQNGLSLPMFPEISEEQIGFVADRVRAFYGA